MKRESPKTRYETYLYRHIASVQEAYKLLLDTGVIEYDSETARAIAEHDSSKFTREEFDPYCKWFFDKRKKDSAEFWAAKQRHYRLNPHHPQHWRKYRGGKQEEMPDGCIVHMVCDWMSFGIIKGDLSEIQEWYQYNNEKIGLTPNERTKTEALLGKIAEIDFKPKGATSNEPSGRARE
ncbi:MAG: DUF5662 family protein [Firmicutes bacterium]|nr:DUF5662 family protein [Bacillota bacterium]